MSYSPKAKIIDWTSFTPSTNVTNATVNGRYRRIGSHLEFIATVKLESGFSWSGVLTIDALTPLGLTYDSSKSIFALEANGDFIGSALILDSGTARYNGVCTSFINPDFAIGYQTNDTIGAVTTTAPITFVAGDVLTLYIAYLPIQEWA